MTNQVVATPRDFVRAVTKRFGSICCDLAANEANAVAMRWLGPGSSVPDALAATALWPAGGLNFCNPPFKTIAPWAKKCAEERKRGCLIALLVPAAVCTGWFVQHVAPHAYVFELTPRVFKVEIRDCILALYTPEGYRGRELWRWR